MPEYLTTVDQLHAAADDDVRRDYGPTGCITALVVGFVAAVAGFAFGPIFVNYVTEVVNGAFMRVIA
ncbi:hypothetical protein [Actinokineospora sp.]|uniref:hypothetical protein n=1 Tax=Actinokineospora sp. TaxID=1872133 RepID=UPI003D6ADED3